MELLVDFREIDVFFIDEPCLLNVFQNIVEDYDLSLGEISVVFCSDEFILSVNRDYLNHDYYTDIITFDYTDSGVVSGDLIVSVDTVLSNSHLFKTDYTTELFRVVIHGVLHLCGLLDKSEAEIVEMREREDFYLASSVSPFVPRGTV